MESRPQRVMNVYMLSPTEILARQLGQLEARVKKLEETALTEEDRHVIERIRELIGDKT